MSVNGCDLHADAARRRPLADHDVDLVVLHGRVEDLLDGGVEAVDLVDEEDVALLEVGEQAGDVDLALERRPGRGVHADAELLGDDAGERRLAEAGRPGDEHVVERVAALLGGLDEDLELLLGHALPDEVGEPARPQAELEVLVVGALVGVADAVLRLSWASLTRSSRVERVLDEVLERRVLGRAAQRLLGLAQREAEVLQRGARRRGTRRSAPGRRSRRLRRRPTGGSSPDLVLELDDEPLRELLADARGCSRTS